MGRIFLVIICNVFVINLFAQLRGTITDENNEPLPFASVYVLGSTNGTTSNGEGAYSLPLEKGKYSVVFQYIGYEKKVESVTIVGDKPQLLHVQMKPNELSLSEVVITPNMEDPAYGIMRKAIAKRQFFKEKAIEEYSCDAYVKGFHKMLDAPKKIFGKDVGDIGGILDTNRQGVLYLSESVSTIYRMSNPTRMKEVMISSKVSGESNGFSLNRANLVDFSLYDENIEIERSILSPLADNAFAYYKFKLLGRTRDENGLELAKIQVIPKREADPVFSGVVYIVEGVYNVQSADLILTGANIKQPALDTLQVVQQYIPMGREDQWALQNQLFLFKFKVLGFKIFGTFNSVFSNYSLKPTIEAGFFNKESFKVSENANAKDSMYWASIRPVPLTTEEASDYVRKDSLSAIWKSKAFMDSMDRKDNKFGFGNLIFGYTWNNSYKRESFKIGSPLNTIQYNTIQGYNGALKITYRKDYDEYSVRPLEITPELNYGLAEERLRGSLTVKKRFNRKTYDRLQVSAGRRLVQFNDENPVTMLQNTLHSLLIKRNYLKAFEKDFLSVMYSRRPTPLLEWHAALEYAQRTVPENNSDYSWYKNEQRKYTSNFPANIENITNSFVDHTMVLAEVGVLLRFKDTYSTYPTFRWYEASGKPQLQITYTQGVQFKEIEGVNNPIDGFSKLQLTLSQNALKSGIAGYSEWTLGGGAFLDKPEFFADFQHFLGNQILFSNSSRYNRSFFALPYYAASTTQPYLEGHIQHHLQGFLLDKIPVVRRWNIKEVVGLNVLYISPKDTGTFLLGDRNPYWEANFGLENLGFGVFRMFRVDVAAGFFGGKYHQTVVRLGIGI